MKLSSLNIKIKLLILIAIGSFTACKNSDDFKLNESLVRPSIAFVGLTNTNTTTSPAGQLIRYNASNINQIAGAAVNITGVQTGESIVAIDYRPATGILYGISNQNRLYILNPATGVARAVNATPFTPALSGGIAGFDFNPAVDVIRVVSKSGQNLRLNPNDGTVVATDANINGIANAVVAEVAFSNNVNGATSTELFNLDIANAMLYKQDANAGTLSSVGSLGLRSVISTNTSFSAGYNTNITNFRNAIVGGFDIAPTGEALAVFNNQNTAAPAIPVGGISTTPTNNPSTAVNAVSATPPTLFQIDLATGKATDLGVIPFPAPANSLPATALIGIAIAPAPVGYAIDDANNNLLIFNLTKPEPVTKTITGLQANETIVGLDFRPSNGQLYGLGNSSRIYVINPATGAATVVGTLPLVPLLSGTSFGFDFIPNADLIRIVSNTGQNLRVSPTTGLITNVDSPINGGNVEISAAAYSNNLIPSTSTNLFIINTRTDSLYRITDVANGRLTRVGKLNVTADAANGFDITTSANNSNNTTGSTGYAILTKGTETRIYTINLTLGSAAPGLIFPRKVRAFTVGLGF